MVSGDFIRFGKAIPERVLPTPDHSVVIAYRAVPMNAAILIGRGIGHDDAEAASMPWVPTAAYGGLLVEVRGGIDNDAGKVLGQQAGAAGHIGERAGWGQVVAQIDNPGVTHAVAQPIN